jgi:hypothetical protein
MRTVLRSVLGARGGVVRRKQCIGCVRYTIVNRAAGENSLRPCLQRMVAAMNAINKLIFLTLIAPALPGLAENCRATGNRAGPSVLSPDRHYEIENVVCSKDTEERALVLHNIDTGVRRILYTYTRDATVLWSPDSHYVAINDYAGSDYTNNLVFSVDKNEPAIDLQKQLNRGLPEHGREIPEADHLYM